MNYDPPDPDYRPTLVNIVARRTYGNCRVGFTVEAECEADAIKESHKLLTRDGDDPRFFLLTFHPVTGV